MTIKQLRKRLDRLAEPREGADGPDLTLAAEWDNSTGGRLCELQCKAEPLTHEEQLERAHLEACQDAWRRLHWPEDVEIDRIAREVYGWADDDDARFRELFFTSLTVSLTPEERSELETLEARRPSRDKLRAEVGGGLKGVRRRIVGYSSPHSSRPRNSKRW